MTKDEPSHDSTRISLRPSKAFDFVISRDVKSLAVSLFSKGSIAFFFSINLSEGKRTSKITDYLSISFSCFVEISKDC